MTMAACPPLLSPQPSASCPPPSLSSSSFSTSSSLHPSSSSFSTSSPFSPFSTLPPSLNPRNLGFQESLKPLSSSLFFSSKRELSKKKTSFGVGGGERIPFGIFPGEISGEKNRREGREGKVFVNSGEMTRGSNLLGEEENSEDELDGEGEGEGGGEGDEEWEEEELDELFENFGETVVSETSEEQRIAREQRDDTESCEFAIAMAGEAAESKGEEIKVLHVKSLVYWARCFVIVTAFSKPQLEAIAKRMKDLAEEKFGRETFGGDKGGTNSWTLLDFGDVVVHIFLPTTRSFYNLEEFYGNATSLPLPFLSEERR